MAKNRPRQNMSLGPNNGGFGSGNSNNNNPGTFAGGGGGGGGNNNNRPRNRNRNNQSDNPFTLQVGQPGAPGASNGSQLTVGDGSRNPPFDPASGGDAGSIFDDPTASLASGEDNSYQNTAWGLLNQAGISNDPVFGSQQTAWLNDKINNLWQTWKGQAAIEGQTRPNFSDWLLNMTGGLAPGTAPDLNYVQTKWGPAMKNYLARQYQAESPRNRGTDMRQWVAPKRVIQFALALASVGSVLVEVMTRN